jgi:hypothetical protein
MMRAADTGMRAMLLVASRVAATPEESDHNDSRSSLGLQKFRAASVEANKHRLQIAECANRAQIQTRPDGCLPDLQTVTVVAGCDADERFERTEELGR